MTTRHLQLNSCTNWSWAASQSQSITHKSRSTTEIPFPIVVVLHLVWLAPTLEWNARGYQYNWLVFIFINNRRHRIGALWVRSTTCYTTTTDVSVAERSVMCFTYQADGPLQLHWLELFSCYSYVYLIVRESHRSGVLSGVTRGILSYHIIIVVVVDWMTVSLSLRILWWAPSILIDICNPRPNSNYLLVIIIDNID